MTDILKLCCKCGGIPKIGMYNRKYVTAECAGESVTYYVECQTCKVDTMIVFQCSNCDKKYPCVIITDDADVPEYCPWTGRKDGCDWNATRVIP